MEDEKKPDEMIKDYTEEVREQSEKKISKRKEILNRRRNLVKPRKYHMTDEDKKKLKQRFDMFTKNASATIKRKAGKQFFNPFRQAGIYYGCVQALYLLGANSWHEYATVYKKIAEVMTKISDSKNKDSWTKFINRSPRKITGQEVSTARDDEGRIKQNMRVLQRLGGIHPYGYKLMQICASIDIKREKNNKFFFMLNTTWKSFTEVKPFYKCDYKEPRKKTKTIKNRKLVDQVLEGALNNSQ